ncbi:nuclease-related domain-containing protein [Metabacillus litoralis]|uniref:nuclease-related domain-containing protein n=1 Tax=Metabacillus litoralis TaxID=152268 RepID=UPI001CFEC89A|nr:nuclease-related domain-containing protein [Metabacillus litoralis]
MLYKTRSESTELLTLQVLNNRMNLSEKDKSYFLNLKKGYEGEMTFDSLTDKLELDCLILNDLLLKQNNTSFQIDSLLITPDSIYLFEVKNFEGDFYYEHDRLYKKPKTEINNPLTQLSRSDSLLRQLLQSYGYHIPIKAHVIFINPKFTLYQAPLTDSYILPTQINKYLTKLNSLHSMKINQKQLKLAEKIGSLHIVDSPFKNIPSYDFAQLQKGITCIKCHFFLTSGGARIHKFHCSECGSHEAIKDAVIRSVHEFKLLFPNHKITTNSIHEWCQVIESKKRISRILKSYFKSRGEKQWTFYE